MQWLLLSILEKPLNLQHRSFGKCEIKLYRYKWRWNYPTKEIKSNTNKITPKELAKAQGNIGDFVSLNPASYNKIITYYNNSGPVHSMNFNAFKNAVKMIKIYSSFMNPPKLKP